MRRLAAALVIPTLAIALATVFSPHAPVAAEAASQSGVSVDMQPAVQPPDVGALATTLQCLVSGAREVVTDWAARDSCV